MVVDLLDHDSVASVRTIYQKSLDVLILQSVNDAKDTVFWKQRMDDLADQIIHSELMETYTTTRGLLEEAVGKEKRNNLIIKS